MERSSLSFVLRSTPRRKANKLRKPQAEAANNQPTFPDSSFAFECIAPQEEAYILILKATTSYINIGVCTSAYTVEVACRRLEKALVVVPQTPLQEGRWNETPHQGPRFSSVGSKGGGEGRQIIN